MTTDPTTEAIPETPDAPSLLAHIESKVAEYATWAKNALALATEHTHAAPLGKLLGTLEQTSREIGNLKGTGVLFALQQPLEAWLDTKLEAGVKILHTKLDANTDWLESKVRTLLEQHAAAVSSKLDTHVAQVSTLLGGPAVRMPAPAVQMAPTSAELEDALDAELAAHAAPKTEPAPPPIRTIADLTDAHLDSKLPPYDGSLADDLDAELGGAPATAPDPVVTVAEAPASTQIMSKPDAV